MSDIKVMQIKMDTDLNLKLRSKLLFEGIPQTEFVRRAARAYIKDQKKYMECVNSILKNEK